MTSTANALRDKIRKVTTEATTPVKMVLIDMESVNYLDLEGCDMLNEIAKTMKSAGVEIHLSRVKHEVMKIVNKDGVDPIIGRDHVHNKVVEGVSCFTENKTYAIKGEIQNG